MIRTYQLGTTGPRRPEGLRDIVRRLEQELATDPRRATQRRPIILASRQSAD